MKTLPISSLISHAPSQNLSPSTSSAQPRFPAHRISIGLNSYGRRLPDRPLLFHVLHVAHSPLQVGPGSGPHRFYCRKRLYVFTIARVTFRTFSPSPFALHVPCAIALFAIKHRHSSFTPVVYPLDVAHATTFIKFSYLSDTAALRLI